MHLVPSELRSLIGRGHEDQRVVSRTGSFPGIILPTNEVVGMDHRRLSWS
jgi:hypothetical protein